jgi:hypothetical protein
VRFPLSAKPLLPKWPKSIATVWFFATFRMPESGTAVNSAARQLLTVAASIETESNSGKNLFRALAIHYPQRRYEQDFLLITHSYYGMQTQAKQSLGIACNSAWSKLLWVKNSIITGSTYVQG